MGIHSIHVAPFPLVAHVAPLLRRQRKAETHDAGFGFSRRGDLLVQPTFLILHLQGRNESI